MKIKSFAILLCGIALVAGTAASGGLIYSSYISKEAQATTTTWNHTALSGQNNTFPTKGTNTFNNISYTLTFQNSGATVGQYNTSNYDGVQMGSSSTKTGLATFTFGNPWGGTGTYQNFTNITKVTIIGNSGETNGTPVSATIGGQAATGSTTKFVRNTNKSLTTIDFTPSAGNDTGSIVVSVTATTAAWYFKSISITASEPEAPTKALSNISVEGELSKTSYYAGEVFDPTGLTITATYDDLSTANVTSLCTFSPSPLTQGTTSVTASYIEGGVTKTFVIDGITVLTRSVTAISISTNPTKMVYGIGQTFNPAGMKVTATYNIGPVVDDYTSYTFLPTTALDTLGDNTITITSTDNPSATATLVISVIDVVTAEGNYTITVPGTNYDDSWSSSDLNIAKSDSSLANLEFSNIVNTRLNSSGTGGTPHPNTIAIGSTSTTGGEFTVTLPEELCAVAVTFNGLAADADKSPILKINNSVSFIYSTSKTSETLHPYARTIVISTVGTSRLWTSSIVIVAKTLNNAALDFGTYFLDSTSNECLASNVTSATWTKLQSAYQSSDASIKSIIAAATPNQSGTALEQAIARYDYIVAKYGYNNFLARASGSIGRNIFIATTSNSTVLLFLSFATILLSGTCLYFLLKKKKEN